MCILNAARPKTCGRRFGGSSSAGRRRSASRRRTACASACNEGRSVDDVCDYLATSRPTAVNLFWALERMRRVAGVERARDASAGRSPMLQVACSPKPAPSTTKTARCAPRSPATAPTCSPICPTGAGILTHCNAGALVSGSGDGTALAVIFELARRGKRPHVLADETRPLLQGARLTMWELHAARHRRHADLRLDRRPSDARRPRAGRDHRRRPHRRQRRHGEQDRHLQRGDAGPRPRHPVLRRRADDDVSTSRSPAAARFRSNSAPRKKSRTASAAKRRPAASQVYNPAFDVTPAELIAAIITDRGVIEPVDADGNPQCLR